MRRAMTAIVVLPFLLSAFPAIAAPPAEAFARMPSFTDIAISPGGNYLAVRANIENQFAIKVYDNSGRGLTSLFGFTEDSERSVDWFQWVSADRLLMSVAMTGRRYSSRVVKTYETRLVSYDASTRELIPLFSTHRSKVPIQIQDRVVSFLPDDPGHILVQYAEENPSRPDVYKVNVAKQDDHRRILRGQFGVLHWMADASGAVRLGSGLKDDNKERFLTIRRQGDKKWINFSHRVASDSLEFTPVGFSPDPDKIFVRSNHEGDPSGLYTFDIVTDEFAELIFKHPTVDIHNVSLDHNTGELLAISFVEDDIEAIRFSEEPIHEDIDKLREQFPDTTLRTTFISDDGQFAVILSQGATDAGRYLVFDRAENQLKGLPHQYPELDGVELGQTFVTEYAARDGLTIPAYVTLPPGMRSLDDAKALPFVVYPHGGPASRDFLRFSFSVQFLVAQGYGVLQMNFRGSEGYGKAFEEAGRREWGQAMQDDITDGAHWLIDTGAADPDKLAILGGSYGGYAALMGAVKTPDLYQCAVSFAGVSDLPELLRLARQYVGGSYSTRFIGDLWKDRKMLAENSPALQADKITVPVLLMHGDEDTVVDIDQSERMARALRKHGKQFEYHVFKDGDHHLSLYENRLQFLTAVERFLHRCLG